MPVKDRYHDAVVHALVKDGWTITKEQFRLDSGKRHLWIDIRAEKAAQSLTILVEVKGFENIRSALDYLANTIGQYILYQAVLHSIRDESALYLAVPEAAHKGILSEEIGQLALQIASVRLLVFNPETEEIIQWIP